MSDEISLVRMLNRLVRAALPELDHAVTETLQVVTSEIGASCACLFRIVEGNLSVSHRYTAPGKTEPTIDADALFTRYQAELAAGGAILIPGNDADPQAAPSGFIAVPIRGPEGLAGVLGFCFSDRVPDLPEERLQRLGAVADTLETVIERQAREILHLKTAQRLEATLSAIPDLLFEVTADGRFGDLSAGPSHLLLVPHEQLKGRRFSQFLPDDVTKTIQGALDHVLAHGRVEGVRYRLDLPSGPRTFEVSGALKPATTESEPTAIFITRDVTADMQMREELSRLGKIVESMTNLVCITDLDENIVWCNAAFERQTGWTLDEIKGRFFGDVIRVPGEDVANEVAVNHAVRGRRSHSGITVNQDRWGNRYWIEFHVMPLHDAAGDLVGFVSIETVITRLKKQEEAMALLARSATEARQRLENAVRAIPDGLIIIDENDRVVVANQAYLDMFPPLEPIAKPGTSLEEILTKGAELGVFGPASQPEARAEFVAQRLNDYSLPSQLDEVRLPDGRWLRRMHTRTSDGGLIAMATDVTARHNQIAALDAANLELREAEHRLRRIIEGADVGTWEWEISTDVLTVGGNWAAMLGLDPDQPGTFQLSDFLALVHADDVPLLPSPNNHTEADGDAFKEAEFRMRHAEGHWVWILCRSRITHWTEDGSAKVMAGVHLDISDRKKLERQLQSGRAYLTEVMDTSIAALAVLNEKGELTYANLEAERILALERSALRGRRYNDPEWRLQRLDGTPLPDEELPFRQAVAHGGIVRNIRFAMHRPDGTRRVLSANAVPLSPADGESHVVVSFSDITEELAATARLEEARLRAEEVSRAKSIFLANMSHEIRTPLNGVLGMAEVLDSIVTEPEQKHMVATIRRSGETLLTVLNSILDMSKIEAGKMELEDVPLVLSDLLSQVEALHRIKAEEKGIELQVLTSAGADLPRMGDPHRLTQVLNNLLSNAIKFTEKGRVRLKVSCRPEKPVTIDVTDTGVGMTEQQLSRVFESFEQADGSMTRRFGGTGLGLSIVRQLVLLMGGMITINSTPGEGTGVRVVLPLPEAKAPPPLVKEPDSTANPNVLKGRKILIADDNSTNRLVLSEMLSPIGLNLTLVENGQDALGHWQKAMSDGQPFDLLLLDITMPVMDGMGALSEIRRHETASGHQPVPAIAVTANAMPNQVADYIMGGFDTHLSKPFKRKELIHALQTLLRA